MSKSNWVFTESQRPLAYFAGISHGDYIVGRVSYGTKEATNNKLASARTVRRDKSSGLLQVCI